VYDMKSEIPWSDFDGVEVKGFLPKRIRLKSKASKPIEFSYYTFDPSQRRALFKALTEK